MVILHYMVYKNNNYNIVILEMSRNAFGCQRKSRCQQVSVRRIYAVFKRLPPAFWKMRSQHIVLILGIGDNPNKQKLPG